MTLGVCTPLALADLSVQKPYAYIVRVGHENIDKVYRSNPAPGLYNPTDIPTCLWEEVCTRETFVPKNLFYGTDGFPWILVPVTKPSGGMICPTWFYIDTGAASTYLTEETSRAIFGSVPTQPSMSLLAVKTNF